MRKHNKKQQVRNLWICPCGNTTFNQICLGCKMKEGYDPEGQLRATTCEKCKSKVVYYTGKTPECHKCDLDEIYSIDKPLDYRDNIKKETEKPKKKVLKKEKTLCFYKECRKKTTKKFCSYICTKKHRLSSKFNVDKFGCWVWNGYKDKDYGVTSFKSKREYAHRASYRAFVGEIPKGKLVLHKCNNYLCINPEHLEIGSRKDLVNRRIEMKHDYLKNKSIQKNEQ